MVKRMTLGGSAPGRSARRGFAISGVAALGLVMSVAAHAEREPGFYVGAGVGSGTLDFDQNDFTIAGVDDSDTALKVYAGYTFNQFISIEAAYIDAGEPAEQINSVTLQFDVSVVNVSVIGHLPLTESFELFGKAGLASYDYDAVLSFNGLTSDGGDDSDQDVSYGFGAAYSFAGPFEIRGEYEFIEIDSGSYDVVSLSGVYKF
jgi:OOP family OmpA-OmpF porin